MDRRKMKKVLKPMIASFVYTRSWAQFQEFFETELDMEIMSNAQRKRLIEVLREMAGGDLMEPKYD
jgi:hypothetical protein